jgi:UDP:flavonoid glycosyltransferase YjiC (YdhE family)
MARIVVLTLGTYGDVAPYVGLGVRLREVGHEVCVAAIEPFRDLVTGAGLAYRALPGADPREIAAGPEGEAAARPGIRGMRTMMRLASEAMRQPVPAMVEAVSEADVVLASMTTTLLAAPIAEARGVPCVFVPLQPTIPTREFGPLTLGGRDLGPWLNTASAGLIARLAVGALAGTRRWLRSELALPDEPSEGHRPGDIPILHGISPTVLPRPRDWRPGVEIAGYWWPPAATEWAPSPELAAFLADGPPPVYVGFGSVNTPAAQRLAGVVGDALRRTGRRAVVQRGWADLEVAGPDVLSVDEVPHEWLFPRMAAVVHHAGAGTTAAALRAGVPSVPVSFTANGDQSFWGRRLVRLGAAPAAFSARRLPAAPLAGAITRAATVPVHRRSAEKIAARLADEDGAALVLDTVAAVTASRS